MKTAGIILMVVGLIMIIYTGFHYVTAEKVVDVGAVTLTREKNHFVQWSPVAGAVLLVSGILLLLAGRKNRS